MISIFEFECSKILSSVEYQYFIFYVFFTERVLAFIYNKNRKSNFHSKKELLVDDRK